MHSTRRNILLIALFAVVFALTFVLEATQAMVLSTSTTVGLDPSSTLR